MLNYQNFIQENKVRVGEILIKKGLVSEAELKQALAEQRELGKKLGEVLIERELITQRQLTTALLEQRVKNGALSIFFITSSLFGLAQGATANEGGASVTVTLSGYVPERVTVDLSQGIPQTSELGNKSLEGTTQQANETGTGVGEITTNGTSRVVSGESSDGYKNIVSN